jgi:NAD(P)-dependent dehydrogenase (short-subunit alcohol dehydrogenase family)
MKTVFISDNREPAAVCAAKYLSENGYNVILNDLGGEKAEWCKQISLDLTDYTVLRRFFSEPDTSPDGVIIPAPPVRRVSIEEADDFIWEEGMRDGALSAMVLTRASGEIMAKNGHGSLIFLGSIHAEKPTGCSFIYSTACSAAQMLCREAALDFGSLGVNSFYIQRGVMEHDLMNKNDYSNVYCRPDLRYPKKRLPSPDSLNGLINFLLTDAAAPLNGSDLRADEGFVMYYGNHTDGTKSGGSHG